MDRDATLFYPSSFTCILIIFDTRDPAVARALHGQRAFWQANANMEAFDEDHFVLVIKPGRAIRRLVR